MKTVEEKTYLHHPSPGKAEGAELERTHLCFFYVGHDDPTFQHISQQFDLGYRKANFIEGNDALHQLYLRNNKLPDVIFIDIPFDEPESKKFRASINGNLLLSALPLIYNERQLSDQQIERMKKQNLVDDIIALDSKRINYYSKVLFLKQTKMFDRIAPLKADLPKYRQLIKSRFYFFLKRFIDITIAVLGILLLSPVFLLIALCIRLESKGPVIYTSLRAGRGFKVFKFFKFRTMHPDADQRVESLRPLNQYPVNTEGPTFFKLSNDPRITRIGKFLRNVSIDELPQLFNVLRGDMSVVGNRPLPIYEAVSLMTNEFAERFSAPAGITGLWQVKKRGRKEMSNEERINLDITYSRNYTSFYDFKILVQTPAALIQKGNV